MEMRDNSVSRPEGLAKIACAGCYEPQKKINAKSRFYGVCDKVALLFSLNLWNCHVPIVKLYWYHFVNWFTGVMTNIWNQHKAYKLRSTGKSAAAAKCTKNKINLYTKLYVQSKISLSRKQLIKKYLKKTKTRYVLLYKDLYLYSQTGIFSLTIIP